MPEGEIVRATDKDGWLTQATDDDDDCRTRPRDGDGDDNETREKKND